MFSRIRLLTAGMVILMVAVVGVVAVACSGDDDDNADAADSITQEQFDQVQQSALKGQVMAVLDAYRIEDIHDWNTEVNEASEIAAGWDGKASRIRQATASVEWPDALAEHAGELQQAASDAEDAIANDDLAATKTAVTTLHESWHHLEPDALAYLAGEAAPDMNMDDTHADE